MNRHFELIRITRYNFLELVNGLTNEQLNKIPAGFNNNIAWNFGHIVVATQGLCYGLAGLPLTVDIDLINRYKKGSAPQALICQDEIEQFKKLCVADINQLEADYNNGRFNQQPFKQYTTSFNAVLTNIDDAIAMVQSHDGLHFGYALAQRRLVIAQ